MALQVVSDCKNVFKQPKVSSVLSVLQVTGDFTAGTIAAGGSLDAGDIPPIPTELPTVPELPGMPQTSLLHHVGSTVLYNC